MPQAHPQRGTQRQEAHPAHGGHAGLTPLGEEDGILFKTLYVTKLPKEVRGHVLANSMHLDSMELSELADDLWCGLNECHFGAKSHQVAAAVPDDGMELAEAVAAIHVQPTRPQHKKTATKGSKS